MNEANSVDRRTEPRFNIDASAQLKIGNKRRLLPVRITNVSDHGMALRMPSQIYSPGEAVRIRVQKQAIWGTLKYSHSLGTDIIAGVELKRALSDEQARAILQQFIEKL